MLKRQALPAGITSGLDLEYIDIKLRRGDLLVMVSDGVTDCDRKDYNCNWLRARLLEIGSRDPETIAELIVNKAAEKYGIHERDDLTVMTASIGV
jgi:stage II sporulation protein E